MTAAAVWLILCALLILTCAAINHRDKKRATKRTTAPVALHVPTETPAAAEWRRRLARWTAEDAS